MDNSIKQFAIGELLDGRYFYIPAYQRGYRWTEKQVGDLLRDLLCFVNDKKQPGDFYCLQPVITRPITDEVRIRALFNKNIAEDVVSHGVWEVIDGQQRLTSILLLYKYLVNKKGWDAETLKIEEDGKEIYHICYSTREGSAEFLENLSLEVIDNNSEQYLENVDFYHMASAFQYIDQWIKTEGKEINQRYKLGGSLDTIRTSLFSVLNAMSDTTTGSVQVLWYELAENNEKSSIREFQKINTGKIRLTDAELIKGLFLLQRNFDDGSKYIKQSTLALEWEFIENTLHANNFWYFLQKKGSDMPNRIDLLFTLIYKKHQLEGVPEEEWNERLKQIDADIADARKSVIFRYYYDMFEGKQGEDLQKAVTEAWDEVMTLFRTLDDWFCVPSTYNYIGLLSQCGEDLSRIIMHFEYMPEESLREDFEAYLKRRICYYLRNIHVDECGHINRQYKNHDDIYKILLTLNIHLLNIQNAKLESDSDVYKFPFDVLNAQNWDIEHIDSYHTNALKREDDIIEWINTSKDDLADLLTKDELKKIESFVDEKNYTSAMHILKQKAQEDDVDDEIKNSIGNLTLLDAQTNRSYGNRLFCFKRRVIIERIKQGVFVPIATQFVFSKFFDEKGTNRSAWTTADMDKYNAYIVDMLKDYINPNVETEDNDEEDE